MSKERTYLKCTVTSENGRVWENPLMLSEIHLVNTLAKEHLSVLVERVTVDEESYRFIFG